MNPLSPLLLQTQLTIPAGGGSFGIADPTTLENPFQAPMWLDEIRFRLPTTDINTQGVSWANVWVELKLGDLPLTKGFVPIGLFGRVLSDALTTGENGNSTSGYSPNIFTWKLPKPLFIPAREFLRPTFYFDPYPGAADKVITVAYACRPLPKGTPTPKVLNTPWVTFYRPPKIAFAAAGAGSDQSDQSTPSDLYNPWTQDLHVQRFVGRLMGQAQGEDQQRMGLASVVVDFNTGMTSTGTLVSAQDSFNNILIRDQTPFAHVFDFLDRAWTVNCTLPPKGFYLFTVDRLWSGYTLAAASSLTVGIGMVGWREVQYLGSP